MSDCYGSKCSAGDWQETNEQRFASESISPERRIRNLIVALHGTAWAKSQAGQLDNIRSQASYLLLQFDKYTQGLLKPGSGDDPKRGDNYAKEPR